MVVSVLHNLASPLSKNVYNRKLFRKTPT